MLVFGNFAFYLILSGHVTPVSMPYVNKFMLKLEASTPEPVEKIIVI